MPNLFDILMQREQPEDPMGLAREELRSSHPDLPNTKVRPMNWLERVTSPKGMQAATYPNGTVTYDPTKLGSNMVDNRNILAHELTHAKQGQGNSVLGNIMRMAKEKMNYAYKDQPSEIEAYKAMTYEQPHDIELPAERYGNPVSGKY